MICETPKTLKFHNETRGDAYRKKRQKIEDAGELTKEVVTSRTCWRNLIPGQYGLFMTLKRT